MNFEVGNPKLKRVVGGRRLVRDRPGNVPAMKIREGGREGEREGGMKGENTRRGERGGERRRERRRAHRLEVTCNSISISCLKSSLRLSPVV
jgi:hypothetical protein